MAIDRVKVKASADKLVMAGKVPEAIREYQKLVEDNPRDIPTLSQLGNLHLRVGNKAAAVPIFIKVAELFNKTGFATKAVASLKIAVREDDKNLRAWELLAELSEQQGFAKEARLSYEKVAELIANTADTEAALRVYTKLTELEPENLKVRLHLGDLLLKQGNRGEALKHYIKAGQSLTSQGKIKEAARVYERALQLDPDNIGTLEGVVKSHVAQRQPQQALALLESLLERTPASVPLRTLKLDVLLEMGHYDQARPEILSLCQANPQNLGLKVRAVRVLIHGSDPDTAASMLGTLSVREQDSAQALYEEILKAFPSHLPSLMGLYASYKAANNRFQILATLSRLAEAALSAGDLARARAAMQELATLEPQNQQHVDKLRFIEAKAGIVAPSPPSPPPPPPPPAPPASPAPPQISVEDTGAGMIDVEVGDLEVEVEVDAEVEVEAPPAPPTPQEPILERPVELPSLEVAAPPPAEEISLEEELSIEVEPLAVEGETEVTPAGPLSPMDAEMIREQFAEAEVFLKYGLGEKAVGALQAVLKKVPDHIQAHQKLIAIYKSQGKKDKAVQQTLHLARVFKTQGDMETCESLLDEARAIDPNHKGIQQFFEAAPAPEKRPAKAASKFSADDLLQGALAPRKKPKPVEAVAPPSPEVAPASEAPLEVVLEEAPPPADAQVEELLSLEPSAEEVKASQALTEQIEEIEFYLGQDLFREARRAAEALLRSHPGHRRVKELLARADAALEAREKEDVPPHAPSEAVAVPAPLPEPVAEELLVEVPATPSPLELRPAESTAEGAIPELSPVEEPPPPAKKVRTKMKVTAEDLLGDDFLADEAPPAAPTEEGQEDFSDLANELGAALDGLEGAEEDLFDEEPKSAEELSFEEVFQEFRKGVDKKVGQDDYSTHYNLGIAYKEMELVDEAIGEFQIAARSPEYFVECCSMLGICFRQKGLLDLAEKWYRKGVDAPGFTDEVYAGLKYDLAEVLESQGRTDEATALFKEVYAINANHRDVKAKVFGS